ncbi:MAG: hypothetical protein KC609_18945, partial [Myxococcales bacterium]|nr:hypothetical protein [Myxococcales bacterium]
MRSRSSWFWVGALALLGVSACNKKKPDRNAPVKVDNRPPFSLVSTRPPIQMGTSLASLLPSDTLLFVELKSLASMHRWLKVDALRKRLGGKADKLLVSVDVVNPYDPQDARAAGLDLARPVAFFIDAYKVSIYGFAFSLTDPALYVARYKSRAVGHTMRKEGATTVLSYKNRRVLIRGKRALVLFSAASAGELDARVKRYGEVRTATSLAKNPLYREGLNALSYGDDLFLFARRMLLVDRLIPQLAGRGLTPGTAFFQKVYRPVKAMLVGLNVTAGEITAKLHLSVPKKSGLFTMFHIGKPALGWTVVQQNALIAFRFQVDLPRYLAYFVKTMSSMESYAKGLAPILDKPIAGGMSPRQVLKTLSGRLEFYLTAPPELHKLTDLDGALFVGLKETKSFEAFLEAALKKAPPGQVKSETIAGVP